MAAGQRLCQYKNGRNFFNKKIKLIGDKMLQQTELERPCN